MAQSVTFTILGEAASKANSRKIVTIAGRPQVIKSQKARDFMKYARMQVPPACRVRMQGPVGVILHMYYATERPDLSEEVLLDALQDHYSKAETFNGKRVRTLLQAGVYCNDRQVRWKLVAHHIDRKNPRVEVTVASFAPTVDMFVGQVADEPLPF